MKSLRISRIHLYAAVGAILALSGVWLLVTSRTKSEPSGDYSRMTSTEALLAECNARNIILSEDELSKTFKQAQQDLKDYEALDVEGHTVEELYWELQVELLYDRLAEDAITDVVVTEDEISDWYHKRFNALTNTLATTPGVFKSQQEYYDKYGGVVPLIVPEGYVRVKHILSYDLKTAEEVLTRLNNDDDFSMLMKEYCQDAGMFIEPYASLGYLVGPYESTMDYLPEFKQAALSLTNVGDYSSIVRTSSGFEIIQLTQRLEVGTQSLEQVHESIHAMLLKYKKSQQLEALLEQWTSP